MKIETVFYQKTYSIGPYLTDRVGFEASITPPSLDNLVLETPEYVLSQLEKAADEWHRKAHPHLYEHVNIPFTMDAKYTPPPSTLTTAGNGPIVIDLNHERLEIEIDNCPDKESLLQWKKDHDVLPGKILNHYTKRLLDLTT